MLTPPWCGTSLNEWAASGHLLNSNADTRGSFSLRMIKSKRHVRKQAAFWSPTVIFINYYTLQINSGELSTFPSTISSCLCTAPSLSKQAVSVMIGFANGKKKENSFPICINKKKLQYFISKGLHTKPLVASLINHQHYDMIGSSNDFTFLWNLPKLIKYQGF